MKKTKVLFLVFVVFCLVFSSCATGTSTAKANEDSLISKRTYPPVPFQSYGGTTRPPVGGKQIVQAGSPLATMAGYNILMQGGTAFDAAVAIAGVQGITEPGMTNVLGGDAEIMVWSAKDQKMYVYNGTGWAPKAATLDYYFEMGSIPQKGALSVQIPGAWAGWMLMLQEHGTMSLDKILDPVITVANEFLIDMVVPLFARGLTEENANKATLDHYKPNGNLIESGALLRNPTLARTFTNLAAAAKGGRTVQDGYRLANDYFYRGPIAQELTSWSKANGGIWDISDFNEFYAERQDPWSTNYKGYEVYVCPPNCQGPVLIEALNMVENFDVKSMGHNSAEYIDLITQILNMALQDRNQYYGDLRFVDVPMHLMTKEYAKDRIKDITPGKAMEEIPEGGKWFSFDARGRDTTFLYVADQYGNVVASTHSICQANGSGYTVENLGFLLNNRMIYFSLDEDHPNALAPRKRTMQTITPTIATKNGKPAFIVGTPGADLQEQAKLQSILAAIEFGFNPQKVCDAARFVTTHPAGLMNPVTFPKVITLDLGVKDEDILKLESYGYDVRFAGSSYFGSIGFAWIYENGYKWGGADPRIDASAVAW